MTVTKFPNVTLPDYKKIAKSVSEEEVGEITEKEVTEYTDYLRKQRAQAEAMSKGEQFDPEKAELPELTDEFVKTLGKFDSVETFLKELKKNMLDEKKMRAAETHRLKIMEEIIAGTKVDVPQVLVDEEIEKMMQKFKHDIEQYKMNIEDYLKQLGKTEEDLKAEWKPDAVKRATMNLILPEIAKEEKLKADADAVAKEVVHIKEHQPDINEQQAKMYVERVLANEAVFKFLEDLK
jgi:trigger factor